MANISKIHKVHVSCKLLEDGISEVLMIRSTFPTENIIVPIDNVI